MYIRLLLYIIYTEVRVFVHCIIIEETSLYKLALYEYFSLYWTSIVLVWLPLLDAEKGGATVSSFAT